jgi:hypothetical protein
MRRVPLVALLAGKPPPSCAARAFAFLLLVVQLAGATTYYVDSTISDIHPAAGAPDCTSYHPATHSALGGSASAYHSVADLNAASFGPGDTILFRRGQTWREQLTVCASGSEGAPIVFGAFGDGAAPILSGADLVGGSWRAGDLAAPIHQTELRVRPKRVFCGSMELLLSQGSPDSPGPHQWNWADQQLYVNLGRAPVAREIEVTQRESVVRDATGHHHVTVQDLHLRGNNIERGGVIKLNPRSDHWAILRATIEYAAGSGFDGESSCGHDLLFSGNLVRFNHGWGVAAGPRTGHGHVYSHNTIHDNGGSGFLVTVQDSVFSHNTVFRNGFRTKHPSHGFYFYNYRGGGSGNLLEHNEVYGHDSAQDGDSGLRLSGSRNVVRYNRFHGNYYAMYVIDAEEDNRHNRIYGNAIYDNGHPIVEVDGAQDLIFSSNYLDSTLQFSRGVRQACARNTIAHNVFEVADGTFITVAARQDAGLASDHNGFSPRGAGRFLWRGVSCDFDGWRTRSGQDAHSTRATPRLPDPGSPEMIEYLKGTVDEALLSAEPSPPSR